MNEKVIGVIGGMGPEATLSFYRKLIEATHAKKDQDHFHVIIDSNSKIPDRTKAILHGGENPLPYLQASVENLKKMNVDVACVTCMTSHYFYEDFAKCADFPIINAFQELDLYIKETYPNVKKVGIMCTSGTKSTGLYDRYLKDFTLVYPDDLSQETEVMESIYGENGIKSGVKVGEPVKLLNMAGKRLETMGAEILIAGCTEIGLVLESLNYNIPIIDPMDVVVKKLTGK